MADNLLVKDATGANVTVRMKDVGAGIEASMSIPTDTSGNAAWGTAGTANANVLTIQGISAGTVVPVSGTVTASQGGPPWSINGAVSNASSAVATSATNVPNVSYIYGWNGATWDQLNATSGNLNVGGNVASSVSDAGNPVKIGGVYNTSFPSPAAGQRVDAQMGIKGALLVQVITGNNVTQQSQGSSIDGVTTTGSFFYPNVASLPMLSNGTSLDREHNNVDTAALITLTTAAASTVNSSDQTNYNGRGVQIGVNITATTGQTLTVSIQGKDIASGQYYSLLTSTALAAVAFTNMTCYPGTTVSVNLDVSDVLPRTWRVQAVVGGAGSTLSATIGASVIL